MLDPLEECHSRGQDLRLDARFETKGKLEDGADVRFVVGAEKSHR
jgi:hypothetical protein